MQFRGAPYIYILQDIKVYLASMFSSICSAGRNNNWCTSVYIISSYAISDLCNFFSLSHTRTRAHARTHARTHTHTHTHTHTKTNKNTKDIFEKYTNFFLTWKKLQWCRDSIGIQLNDSAHTFTHTHCCVLAVAERCWFYQLHYIMSFWVLLWRIICSQSWLESTLVTNWRNCS